MKFFLPIVLVLLALLFVWMTYVALSDLHEKGALTENPQKNSIMNEQKRE